MYFYSLFLKQNADMVIKIVIFITIILNIVATVVSLRLIKRTKYNISWILISIGFVFLLSRKVIETLPFFIDFDSQYHQLLIIWFGTISSFFFAVGLIFIRKIFDYMEKMEKEKRADEKRFLSLIIEAEEGERRRLAKELHDGLGPLLSSVKMSISALKKYQNDKISIDILNNVDIVINESIISIKDISNNLSPHILDNFGLTKAINNFIQKINTTKTINFDFTSNLKDVRLDQNIEVVIYRVVCELINNTLKHANAKIIIINLSSDLYSVYVDYTDDGKGFEVDNLFKPQEKGMGLNNIFSRINSLKGTFEINSEPEKGTEIKIKIPLKNGKE